MTVAIGEAARRAGISARMVRHYESLANLSERIAAMQAMQRSLQALVGCCHGDGRPDCPILDDLAG